MSTSIKSLLLLVLLPLLAGCDQMSELLGLPNPEKEAAAALAEGKAVGGACRLAGRSLEDCYILNPSVQKAAVVAGWKDMNDYMTQNKVEVIPSRLPSPNLAKAAPENAEAASADAGQATDKAADGTDEAAQDERSRSRPHR